MEEAKQLRAKVASKKKTNALANGALLRGKSERWPSAGKERVNALEPNLEAVQDAQEHSIKFAEESKKQAAETVVQLATSLQRVTEIEKNVKSPADRLVGMPKPAAEFKKAADDALRRFTNMSERTGLLEREAVFLDVAT